MSKKFISVIYQHPVKGCKGIALDSVNVGPKGPGFDRRWMIVDSTGRFLSQRQLPKMALIETRMEGSHLFVGIPGGRELQIPVSSSSQTREVTVWDDTCLAKDQGDAIAEALSRFLEKECRLVFMPDSTIRQVNQKYALGPENIFGFADGYPFLLISEASLKDLNSRLEKPVPMDRFRPNLVISGCEPYEEDTWKWIRIGDIRFNGAKLCSRCMAINVDQSKGEKTTEPFQTLASFRKQDTKINFGLNMIHTAQGALSVGQEIEILELEKK
jgi:uncharacterized protein YcbX